LTALSWSVAAKATEKSLPVVDKKLYPTRLNPEFSLMVDYSLATRYTTHQGLRASALFHIIDQVAVELHGGYLFGSESSIMKVLRDRSKENRRTLHQGREPAVPGLQQLTYHLGADLHVIPIYGKLSFVSELESSFQVYGLVGLGLAGTRTVTDGTRLANCNSPSFLGGGCADFYAGPAKLVGLPGISPSGNDILGAGEYQVLPLAVPVEYGLGFRLFFSKWAAFRAEIRNHHWLGVNTGLNPLTGQRGVDLNVVENEEDEGGCTQGYRLSNAVLDPVYSQLSGGARPCYLNVHSVTLARVGLSFMIPVNSFF
jgi:outer membrane beta-barrel protein